MWDLDRLRELVDPLLARAREFPRDEVLAVAAAASVAFLLVLLAWLGAARRARHLRRELDRALAETAALQAKYDAEVRWRLAAEEGGARPSASPPPVL